MTSAAAGPPTEPGEDRAVGAARVVGADRVLAVLLRLGDHPAGVSLEELATELAAAKPTVHRALASLCRVGLAARIGPGVYTIGDEFLRVAFRNFAERPDVLLIEPVLRRLSDRYGETAHYAVLDGAEVVYRAKTDPPGGGVRLTSVIGGRNPAFSTAVGKLLLAGTVASERELVALLGPDPLPRITPNTIRDVPALWRELERTRERGYAIDDQENEVGVNCVAVPVRLGDGIPATGAVSLSAVAFRLPLPALIELVPAITAEVAGGA